MNPSRIASRCGCRLRVGLTIALVIGVGLWAPDSKLTIRPPETAPSTKTAPESQESAIVSATAPSVARKDLPKEDRKEPTEPLLTLRRGPFDAAKGSVSVPVTALRGKPLEDYEEALPNGALVRIGSTRFRHPTELMDNEVLAGRFLATARYGIITLTDLSTGKRVWSYDTGFTPNYDHALRLLISPDGRWFVVWNRFDSRESARVLIWRIQKTNNPPIDRPAEVDVRLRESYLSFDHMQFSADSNELYLSGAGGLCVIDPATAFILKRIETKTNVMSVAIGGKRFLTTSDRNPRVVLTFGGGIFSVPQHRFCAPTPSDKENKTRSWPQMRAEEAVIEPLDLTVRDTGSGNVVTTISAVRTKGVPVGHLMLSPDGNYVSAILRGDLTVWEVSSGRRVLTVSPPARKDEDEYAAWIWSGVFSKDAKRLIAKMSDESERHYELPSGRMVKQISAPAVRTARSYFEDERFKYPNISKGVIQPQAANRKRHGQVPPGYAGVVMDASRDGQFIAIGDRTGRLDVCNTNGGFIANLLPGQSRILSIAFSPDGSRLAASTLDRVVYIWSMNNWRGLVRFHVPADHDHLYPQQLTFAPNGQHLLINATDIMAMCDVESDKWVWDLAGELDYNRRGRLQIAFAPDGKKFAVGGRGHDRIHWINSQTGNKESEKNFERQLNPNRGGSISAMALSPDGRTIAAVYENQEIQFWDVSTERLVGMTHAGEEVVSKHAILHFSPDGRRLATCDDHGRARIWEVATGDLMHTLEYTDGAIDDLRFGKDSRTLITSNHREVIVWSLRPANRDMPAGGLAECWEMLGSSNVANAERARWLLFDDPMETVKLARDMLPPSRVVDDAQVRQWIASLDSRHYRDRAQAESALRAQGQRVLKHLREASTHTSEEIRRRALALARELEAGPGYVERLQTRAVEVLELIGDREAWRVIEWWSQGSADSTLTLEAQKAVRRKP